MGKRNDVGIFLVLILLLLSQFLGTSLSQGVQLQIQDNHVVLDNGILEVTISNPEGYVTGVRYNGVDNLLELRNKESNRGYWDHTWGDTNNNSHGLDRIPSTKMKIIVQTEDQVEISFTRMWDPSLKGKFTPLNIDKRFVMLRGSSGFYNYVIHERPAGWPAFHIENIRMVFKLTQDKFHYMAISDDRQRYMPLQVDREEPRGRALAYPEAVLLVNPIEPEFKGEVDDKYQYSMNVKDIQVHGWISTDPAIGFWQIIPNSESQSFGPFKQYLTSHVGPTSMTTFHTTHYLGRYEMSFGDGEPWKKVYGPFFVYVNSLPDADENTDVKRSLWEDAKNQFSREVENWPYNFPASEDFAKSNQRGSVGGRLRVKDRFVNENPTPASGAYVVLAAAGESGYWEKDPKGYQYWTEVHPTGSFVINNVRPGSYNLYAFVPGFIGDYVHAFAINITSGLERNIGEIVFEPPRDGPTLWEIGIPDRSAGEFYVPDPNPNYVNKLYINHTDKFRQYGLWERYAELYTKKDPIYTIGVSDYKKDWFFAQNTRKINDTYQGTTWQIKFKLDNVNQNAIYKLRLAVAAANGAQLWVRVNDPLTQIPLVSIGLFGKENTIARHGVHGLYRLYNVDIPGRILRVGDNTIFLTQTKGDGPFVGIMYDYIRLEGPIIPPL